MARENRQIRSVLATTVPTAGGSGVAASSYMLYLGLEELMLLPHTVIMADVPLSVPLTYCKTDLPPRTVEARMAPERPARRSLKKREYSLICRVSKPTFLIPCQSQAQDPGMHCVDRASENRARTSHLLTSSLMSLLIARCCSRKLPCRGKCPCMQLLAAALPHQPSSIACLA